MRFRDFIESKKGVITAYNPQGEKASPGQNEKRNKELRDELEKLGGEVHTKGGAYKGHEEDLFVVPKISKSKLLKLGKKYDQETVGFGGKELEVEDRSRK